MILRVSRHVETPKRFLRNSHYTAKDAPFPNTPCLGKVLSCVDVSWESRDFNSNHVGYI